MSTRKASAPMFVAVAALAVATGGSSYAVLANRAAEPAAAPAAAAASNVANAALVEGASVEGRAQTAGLLPGLLPKGARWVVVNADGKIEAQSGGFKVAAAYPTLANTSPAGSPSNALRANGNVYISAGEDLSDHAVVATIALQNATDQNGDGITNGRAPGADSNPEFSGEISATACGLTGIVTCAPTGTNTTSHFVVSPRNSDGTVTTDGARKRFVAVIL